MDWESQFIVQQYGILHIPPASGSLPQLTMGCSKAQAFNCQPLTSTG